MTVLVIVLAVWAVLASALALAFWRADQLRRPHRGATAEGLELDATASRVTREHYRDR